MFGKKESNCFHAKATLPKPHISFKGHIPWESVVKNHH